MWVKVSEHWLNHAILLLSERTEPFLCYTKKAASLSDFCILAFYCIFLPHLSFCLHPFGFLQGWDLKGLNVGGKAPPLPVTTSHSS